MIPKIFFSGFVGFFLVLGLSACGIEQQTHTNNSLISSKSGSSSNIDGKLDVMNDAGNSYIDGEPNVIMSDPNNSYSIDEDGNVSVSYRNGDVKADVPLKLDKTEAASSEPSGKMERNIGFFISEGKTAIVYGASPFHILISNDMGKKWNDYTIEGTKGYQTKFIGFKTKNDGWMVGGFDGALAGASKSFVYQTSDGGETWKEIGNPNDIYAEQLTSAGFSTKEIGFLGYRYFEDSGPVIYSTKDQGQTWERLSVLLPKKFDKYKKNPRSPIFYGKEGLFPISLHSEEANEIGTIYLHSKDEGRTWEYDESYDELKE